MTIDAKSGVVRWEPAATDPAKRYVRSDHRQAGCPGKKPLLTGDVRIELVDPNKPPTLEVATDHSGLLGTEVAFTAKGQDPDGSSERLRYSLADAPDGATINSRTGSFSWTPSEDVEPKEYTFEVIVTDSGSPSAESDRKSVTVALKENTEKYVKLIAIVAEDGERNAWLYDISTKKQHIIPEGGPFEAAGLKGFIYVIGQEFVEFQSGTRSYRLSLGKFLSERQEIVIPRKAADTKTDNNPTTAEKPASK